MAEQQTASHMVAEAQAALDDMAVLRSDRFRLEREGDWSRLDSIITMLEKGRRSRISDEDSLALPTLYRKTVSALSIARESSLDAGLIGYLEALTSRAYYQVYGPRTGFAAWFVGFFGGGWSRAVRAIWLDLLIIILVMIAGGVVGYILVDQNTDWYYSLVDAQMASGRVPGADPELLKQSLGGGSGDDGLSVFAAFLFSNNAQVAILAFALGFALGIPSILLVVHNLALLGAMLWVFVDAGLGAEFVGWLSIHGTTEILAIALAGAAGLHIGRSIAFPGKQSHMAALRSAGLTSAIVMTGVVLMLVLAGLLEGYARQLITQTPIRYAIGYTLLALWAGYFAFAGRRKEALMVQAEQGHELGNDDGR
ncbi:stage II sporulation protein M [Alterisphingorhabdus coralli]|uniref:Stage II sporulation protein M n=1 Tax=Alterisphingorhabdus coralli TaxID=3071408 RepID=A0AA97I2X7_9SPHN|nr:stage II sporulation protein M [Parasphingorhabdus sp. SCSIO 66989]WOE76175.1 stage II sporulation protein M [Parasphingorhabdus sp. SCSIO 66989]